MPQSPQLAVLVVEDEPLLLLDGMCIFEDAGFEAIPAANAAEAICILEERQDIRAVITDVGMPGTMDGLTLCATIHDRWPKVGLIIISGRNEPASADLPAHTVFLAKPYEVKHLLDTLSGFIGQTTAA